jgi:hypothetical protein
LGLVRHQLNATRMTENPRGQTWVIGKSQGLQQRASSTGFTQLAWIATVGCMNEEYRCGRWQFTSRHAMRQIGIGNERRRWAYWMIFYELNTTDADQLDAYETFTTR